MYSKTFIGFTVCIIITMVCYKVQINFSMNLNQSVCDSYKLDGMYELEQFQEYLKMDQNKIESIYQEQRMMIRNYTLLTMSQKYPEQRCQTLMQNRSILNKTQCEIKMEGDGEDPCHVFFHIQEEVWNKSILQYSHGGSNFRIEIFQKDFISICQVKDEFTGHYKVICPYWNSEELYLKVLLMFTNFHAYSPNKKLRDPQKILIFEVKVKFLYHSRVVDFYEGWKKHGDKWLWYKKNEPMRFFSQNEMRECIFNKTQSILAFGASHMRYYTDYLLQEIGFHPENLIQKHGDNSMGNIQYQMSTLGTDMPNVIHRVRTNTTKTSNDFVFLMIGAWDLHRFDPKRFITTGIPAFLEGVRKLQNKTHWGGAQYIWFTSTAYPDDQHAINWKNNYAIAAGIAYLRPHMLALGCKELNVYNVVLPRNTDVGCPSHYLCMVNGTAQGYVGKTIVQMVLHDICNT